MRWHDLYLYMLRKENSYEFPFLREESRNSSHILFNEILMKSRNQSVAVLGGAFDPVHLGHLSLAEDAYRTLALDEIWFVPTAQSPLKENPAVLGNEGRLMLLESALEPYPFIKIDRSEIERGGVSYTVDSVRHFKAKFPDTDFHWIIGGDQVAQLEKWKDIHELSHLVQFIVVSRPGYEIDTNKISAISGLQFSEVRSRLLDIASTEIRERIAGGRPVSDLLPSTVNAIIVENNFYKE